VKIKSRHAGVLALVGWYLMAPPMSGRDSYLPELAPLSRWATFDSFDTAKECRDARSDMLKATRDFVRKKPLSKEAATDNLRRYAAMFGQCIASDDPRLAK